MNIIVKEILGDRLTIHSTLKLEVGECINIELLNTSWQLDVVNCYCLGKINIVNCIIKGDWKSLEDIISSRNYDITALETTYQSYQNKAEKVILELSTTNVAVKKELEMYESLLQITNYLNSHIADGNSIYTTISDMLLGALGVDYVTFYSTSRLGYLMLKHTNCPNVAHHVLVKEHNKNRKLNLPSPLDRCNIVELTNSLGFDNKRRIKSMVCVPILESDKFHYIIFEHHAVDDLKDNQIKYLNIIKSQLVNFFRMRELYIELRNSANKDGLTGLYTREYLIERLQEEIEDGKKNYAICMIDIDNFKICNDTYGHPYGDQVLKAISDVFRNNTRKSDIIARFGGEEIIGCFLSVTDKNAIINRLESLRKKVTEIKILPNDYSPSVSIGVSFADRSSTIESMIVDADKALYEAKGTGKNKLVSAICKGE